MKRSAWTVSGLTLLVAGSTAVAAVSPASESTRPAPSDTRGAEFFETKVRPLLSAQCAGCHSGAGAKGHLDLNRRESILKGGDLGPALVPGEPDKSLLIQAVRYDGHLKMPPKGRLSDQQIKDLSEWVRMGAPWGFAAAGRAPASPPAAGGVRPAAPFWAFQPVKNPPVPRVNQAAWVSSPIDAFILARLEAKGLKPNRPADRRTLLRRAAFDLHGVPPTPEEVEAFVSDRSADAWEKVVDRLLASPRYGERWGRHWLDVARYADSNGLDENEIFPHAWRYRDYVIRSLNEDKPYDQFIREQLAGDLLPGSAEQETYDRLVATGFLVIGPKLLAERDKPKLTMDVIDEQIDTTGRAFLGLTLGCARCHDHKFDPIPTKDYYALAGIFKSTITITGTRGNVNVSNWMERPLAKPEVATARAQFDAALAKLQDQLKKARDAAVKARLAEEIKTLQAQAPPELPMAMAVKDGKIEDVRVHIRGNHLTLGEVVPRHFLTVAAGGSPTLPATTSGRKELADWIASPKNPLTARVIVNRLWLGHFGEGLVRTPDNFGKLGERPTHPELLDWLAVRLVQGGWSLKKLHREIMLSSAYRMSSEHTPAGYAADPENRLLWRVNRRRLEAEAIRDAMLAAGGQIDWTPGGVVFKRTGTVTKYDPQDYASSRRSVYLPAVRTVGFDFFQAFDWVDPHVSSGKRAVTTVAPQALFMLNSPLVREQAEKFAALLLARTEISDPARIILAYERALGRRPEAAELTRTLTYLGEYARETEPDPQKRRQEAWESFCQALFASSEFRYVE